MGELMTQLSSQTSRLVRDEIRLAQKEFVESAKHAGIGAGLWMILAGIVVEPPAALMEAIKRSNERILRLLGRPVPA